MGVYVMTGILAGVLEEDPDQTDDALQQFELINRVLKAHGIKEHEEPLEVPSSNSVGEGEFSSDGLMRLQRAYAFKLAGKPVPQGEFSKSDKLFTREIRDTIGSNSHLLNTYILGCFVPIDFETPIRDTNLESEYLGSTQRLQREMREVAPFIGIEWDGENPTRALLEQWASWDSKHPQTPEREAWAHLWHGTEISIKYGCAMAMGC